ncbi:ribonuclease T2 [Periophthalmus magnuspinnatus]|uniref:ribonuclease T2 n=1 Tax=Periophthalmus magnuspinnatus TaxID=409849 RepID=UPI00145A4E23|nr:ribonuclease T2 [Periophthalmus magnuspinnatus]
MKLILLHFLAAATASAFVLSPQQTWTKLILTHHWPTTFCGMEKCHTKIDSWTLHGLWANNGNDCNATWHFNVTLIEDLLPDMEKSWPDLLNPESTKFWKYEWYKHGTCAAKAESLNSQHKYFSKALELYHKMDLDSVLKKFDINPSKQYYPFGHIQDLVDGFYGAKLKLQCVHPPESADYQILGQIEICFTPDFSLMDCERETREKPVNSSVKAQAKPGFSVCDPEVPVYYPPTM